MVLRSKGLLTHINMGKTEGRIKVPGRRGRRRKLLLDYLKEKKRKDTGNWKRKHYAHTLPYTDTVLGLQVLFWILEPRGRDQYVVPKRRLEITTTRCVITQSTAVLFRGNSRSHSLGNSLWKWVWSCRKVDYKMKLWICWTKCCIINLLHDVGDTGGRKNLTALKILGLCLLVLLINTGRVTRQSSRINGLLRMT